MSTRPPLLLVALFAGCLSPAVSAQTAATESTREAPAKPKRDYSGKARKGEASYYGREFAGKKMADGTPMDPRSNAAASKTLPLGTTAEVTNLENGKTAEVEIRDRGPYVDGRIIDVTPRTAEQLGFKEDGVAPVKVAPIEVPQRDGSVKPGAAADKEAARTQD